MVLSKRRSARPLLTEEPAEGRPTPTDCALEVAVVWGDAVLEAGLFSAGPVRLGGKRGDLQLHVGAGELHLFAVVDGPRAYLTAPDGGSIELSRAGGAPIAAGGAATLGLEDRARVQVGALTLVCRFVRPPLRTSSGLGRQLDLYFSRSLAVSLLAHLAALAVLIVTPRPESLLDPIFQLPRLPSVPVVTQRPEVKPPDFHVVRDPPPAPSFHQPAAQDHAQRVTTALTSGVLGALDGLDANGLFGPGLGADVSNALDRLGPGSSAGLGPGIEGLGSRGGPGGVGPGGLGILGNLTGHGGPGGPPSLGRPGGKHERVEVQPCGDGPCRGPGASGLGKDVIGEVIRRHQNQIRYCFETALQKKPELGGKVAVQFVIDGTGQVTEATIQLDSVGPEVSGCMLERIRRWRFPEPKGGGQVLVTYPWILRSAGGDE